MCSGGYFFLSTSLNFAFVCMLPLILSYNKQIVSLGSEGEMSATSIYNIHSTSNPNAGEKFVLITLAYMPQRMCCLPPLGFSVILESFNVSGILMEFTDQIWVMYSPQKTGEIGPHKPHRI